MAVHMLPQPPAFTEAVHAYWQAYRAGIRDMDILGPLMRQIEEVFYWQPGPPTKPLTKQQINTMVKTWQELDEAHNGKVTEAAQYLIRLPKGECCRMIDMWIHAMIVMKDIPED